MDGCPFKPTANLANAARSLATSWSSPALARGSTTGDPFGERPQSRRRYFRSAHLWPVIVIHILRNHVDVNQIAFLAPVPKSRLKFNWVVSHRNHQIGCIEDSVSGLCSK